MKKRYRIREWSIAWYVMNICKIALLSGVAVGGIYSWVLLFYLIAHKVAL